MKEVQNIVGDDFLPCLAFGHQSVERALVSGQEGGDLGQVVIRGKVTFFQSGGDFTLPMFPSKEDHKCRKNRKWIQSSTEEENASLTESQSPRSSFVSGTWASFAGVRPGSQKPPRGTRSGVSVVSWPAPFSLEASRG